MFLLAANPPPPFLAWVIPVAFPVMIVFVIRLQLQPSAMKPFEVYLSAVRKPRG
ncbi:hypothetical protein HUW62_01895 [Myxococcus sp. AM011]|uniref:hypothetical protein n=1 Tax=Myxococcus sp. AM011 TaxID=2745200 RepID=UPI0015958879|nr:hypothetical protein [Myxococcus sp. AM011]NVJ19991.1 hypothetical protein [Myxococcus sp. AM011]